MRVLKCAVLLIRRDSNSGGFFHTPAIGFGGAPAPHHLSQRHVRVTELPQPGSSTRPGLPDPVAQPRRSSENRPAKEPTIVGRAPTAIERQGEGVLHDLARAHRPQIIGHEATLDGLENPAAAVNFRHLASFARYPDRPRCKSGPWGHFFTASWST